jgi:hypothetical protein
MMPVSNYNLCFKIGLSPFYSRWNSIVSPTMVGFEGLSTGYKALQSYLKQNKGTPSRLTSVLEDPSKDSSGTFGAQLLTAMVNVELWERYAIEEGVNSTKLAKYPLYDIIWTPNNNKTLCDPDNLYPTNSVSPVNLGNILEISDMVIGNTQSQSIYNMVSPFVGWTAWNLSNTPAHLTNILASFNEGFDNCRKGPKAICWTIV